MLCNEEYFSAFLCVICAASAEQHCSLLQSSGVTQYIMDARMVGIQQAASMCMSLYWIAAIPADLMSELVIGLRNGALVCVAIFIVWVVYCALCHHCALLVSIGTITVKLGLAVANLIFYICRL
jgi:hypothetical protein